MHFIVEYIYKQVWRFISYLCMSVQNAVTTCVHFGCSLCVCVLRAALLEDTFDDELL